MASLKNLPSMQETQERWVQSLVRKLPWRRKWQPTSVFLLGKSHGQRNLVDCSPWGYTRVRHNLMAKQQSVLLPGKSHGQRSLVNYSPWGCTRVGHYLVTKQKQKLCLKLSLKPLVRIQCCSDELQVSSLF